MSRKTTKRGWVDGVSGGHNRTEKIVGRAENAGGSLALGRRWRNRGSWLRADRRQRQGSGGADSISKHDI